MSRELTLTLGRGVDTAAVDALRRDHLLAPASPYQEYPEFAHDEVRRYATAILLVRSRRPTELLEAAGVPRWALSAGTLACKGLLKAPDVRPADCFVQLLSQFMPFSTAHGSRWADVPVEAVLEMPFAYDCLEVALDDHSAGLVLGDVVRVVQQRHKVIYEGVGPVKSVAGLFFWVFGGPGMNTSGWRGQGWP